MQAANQAAQQLMGSYIIMPQAAAMGHMPGMSNQSMVNQALQMQQQIMIPQIAGYGMQYPFLPPAMMQNPGSGLMQLSSSGTSHLVPQTAYPQRSNKLRPKASENVTLPDPLPECIEKIEESKDLYCPVCELSVNSQQQLTQHLGSTKHKLVSLGLLPKPSDDPTIKRVGQYKCKICDVILNSEAQLVQHLKSLRHQAAERGEELPPRGERRFCPYSRNKKKEDGSEPGSLSGNGENINSSNSEAQKTVTEELLSKVTPLQLPVAITGAKDADIPTTPEALTRTTLTKPDSVCNSSSPSLKSDQ